MEKEKAKEVEDSVDMSILRLMDQIIFICLVSHVHTLKPMSL